MRHIIVALSGVSERAVPCGVVFASLSIQIYKYTLKLRWDSQTEEEQEEVADFYKTPISLLTLILFTHSLELNSELKLASHRSVFRLSFIACPGFNLMDEKIEKRIRIRVPPSLFRLNSP